MKTSFRLLLAAAVFGPLLSSCVVDPYGMPVAGVGYAGPSYSSVGYYNNSGYWGGSYASPYAYPASTSFTYISGGYGRGYSRPFYGSSCNRPVFVAPSRHCSSGGSPFFGSSHHHRSSAPVMRSAPMPSFQGNHHGAPSSRPSASPSVGSNPFFSHSGSHGSSHGGMPGGSHGHGSPSFAALSGGGSHHSAPSSSHGGSHHHR